MSDTNPQPPFQSERISTVLRQVMHETSPEEWVSIGEILDRLGVLGFAFLLLVLSLLNIVIFMVPLISILFGLPMIILAAQMVVGLNVPIFPRFIRARKIPRDRFVQGLSRSIFGIEKAEKLVRPRLLALSSARLNRIHGLLALALAVGVTVPVPLVNTAPALAIAMLAIGLLEKDGVFIVCGYGLALWCMVLFEQLGHVLSSLGL